MQKHAIDEIFCFNHCDRFCLFTVPFAHHCASPHVSALWSQRDCLL
jgi:hypothetical protein